MQKNLPLTLIFIVVFIDLLGFGILIPILPTFAKNRLGVSESLIGIVIATYSFVQFLFNPVFGSLSDRFGRRKIILITLLINSLGYVIFSVTNSFLLLILSRVVAGIGGSSIGVAQAYISDITTLENRSKGMGLIGVAFGLGFVFGPVIGGVLSKIGYFETGLAAASFSLLAFVCSYFFLPEPEKHLHGGDVYLRRKIIDIAAFKRVLSNESTGFVIALFFFLTFSVANIYGTFALLGEKIYHFSDLQNGLLFGYVGLISAIIQGGLIGRLNKKYSDKQLLLFGFICMTLGLGLLPYGGNTFGLLIIVTLMSLGTGSLQPVLLSLISKVSNKSEQGFTLGVNQSMASLARVLGPLWGGFSFQYLGYDIPFLTGGIFCLFMIIFVKMYYDRFVKINA
ncbi:MAG: MFS transporter [Ignavibacteriaceae bacterium]|nr:MFS transporter [Ignavibacteriaceae bacterium]